MKKKRKIWTGFIALEGIDGSGTTTLARLLTQELKEKNILVNSTAEPTKEPIGRMIREALQGKYPLSSRSLALLFAADRQEHLYRDGGIGSLLEKGYLVITDRYLFSSLAYQTLDQPYAWVEELNQPYPLPSHLIYLKVPTATAQQRMKERNGRDIFDEELLQDRVSQSYQQTWEIYRNSGMNILEADARLPPETLTRQAMDFLAPLFEQKNQAKGLIRKL